MLTKLQKQLGIKFRNQALLKQALIHRSYLNETEQDLNSNERLEFLGDAVLELWTTETLFEDFPELSEGILTNIRAAVVCTTSLAETAKKLNLGKYLFLSKGEVQGKGRENTSLLANTFEAVVGAIYLDQGKKNANKFLDKNLGKKLNKLGKKGDIKDAKTLLQEIAQEKEKITPEYQTLDETGPDHDKTFTSGVFLGESQIAVGEGKSKREAEENAAGKALTIINKKGKI